MKQPKKYLHYYSFSNSVFTEHLMYTRHTSDCKQGKWLVCYGIPSEVRECFGVSCKEYVYNAVQDDFGNLVKVA